MPPSFVLRLFASKERSIHPLSFELIVQVHSSFELGSRIASNDHTGHRGNSLHLSSAVWASYELCVYNFLGVPTSSTLKIVDRHRSLRPLSDDAFEEIGSGIFQSSQEVSADQVTRSCRSNRIRNRAVEPVVHDRAGNNIRCKDNALVRSSTT